MTGCRNRLHKFRARGSQWKHNEPMDHAVALVQAYLQLNGYFTSAEYPIVAGAGRNGFRTITDIDILAFRFPTEGVMARGRRAPKGLDVRELDPGLAVPAESIDMIIGEV